MEITTIPAGILPEEYNLHVYHPLQSWEWGEAKKNIGNGIIRISDGATNYLMTVHPIPYTSYKIGYIPRSPLLNDDTIGFLIQYAKKNKLIYIKIEPYVEQSPHIRLDFGKYRSILKKSPHPLFPEWTMTLDIRQAEENLLRSMKPKTRYNINLASRRGVVVREMSNNEGFDIFSKLYFETCQRQGYYGHTNEYHKKIWGALQNKIAHILIAYYNDEPLAAYELFYFNKRLHYPYGGTSANHRNLMAANLIMWESILLGKKLKAETFDMWGSLGPNYDPNDEWAGFTRFKEGYGARFTHLIGSYDIVINKPAYKIFNFVNSARNRLLQLGKI